MKTVKAIIEQGNDGTYGVYIDLNENGLNYAVIGDGKTVQEAKEDFYGCYDDMKKSFEKDKQPFEEVEFEFEYDIASFLNYYSKVITLSGLEKLTGVNQRQLSHYATGRKHPRPIMVRKIETSLHNFSRELSQVHFYV
ncbi:transcriptional regulator [Bacteroidia bacterium]|nr:transcriptional regulator [Bacteroidia bacterium]GHT81429.1 transcriptional regulator [Bacteroidia bacterium]